MGSRKHRGSRRRKTLGGRRRKYGGACSGSAHQFVYDTVGSGDAQFNRVFDIGAGATPYGNAIVGINGENSVIPPSVAGITGGRRHKKKGGQWAQVLSTAAVPASLLYLQNKYSKKRGLSSVLPKLPKFGGRKTRRHRR
jgi:hypothetical protein